MAGPWSSAAGSAQEAPLRILVTGHNGYIGSVLVPVLERAGHEVVGLDSDLFAACIFGAEPPEVASLRADVRDVESEDLVGFDAVIHLAAVCNDPVGDLNPQATYDINHLASVRVAEKAKEAGVTRFLFSSSCSLYGKAGDEMLDESAEFAPVTPYGRVEGARRARHLEPRRRLVQPDLPAQRDRLRRLAAAARRRGRQQPRRLRPHDRRGPDPERRHALAPARARRGHRRRVPRGARGAARARPRRGLQRRREQRELPDPRPRRDRRGGRARRARDRSRPAADPTSAPTGSTARRSRACCRSSEPRWTVPSRRRAAARRLRPQRSDVRASSPARDTCASTGFASCRRPAGSTTSSAGGCRSARVDELQRTTAALGR